MRLMARASALLALLVLAACGQEPPTTPTTTPPLGTPQTLTASVTPSHVPYGGGTVTLVATITVEPGARVRGVPITYTLRSEGAPLPMTNTEYAPSDGRIELAFFIARASELTVRAGTLERTLTITRDPEPPMPDSPPPTCNGQPGPCPQPEPVPIPPLPPPPPAPPTVDLTLTAAPNPAVLAPTYDHDGNPNTSVIACESDRSIQCVAVTFTVAAAPRNGAGVVNYFAWNLDEQEGFEDITTARTRTRTVVYRGGARILSATVRAVTVDGISNEETIQVAIASALAPR